MQITRNDCGYPTIAKIMRYNEAFYMYLKRFFAVRYPNVDYLLN